MLPTFPTESDLYAIKTNPYLAPYAYIFPDKILNPDLVGSVKEHLVKFSVRIVDQDQREAFLQVVRSCGIDVHMYQNLSEFPANVLCVDHKITESGTFVGAVTPGLSKQRRISSFTTFLYWFISEIASWYKFLRETQEDTAMKTLPAGIEVTASVHTEKESRLENKIDVMKQVAAEFQQCFGLPIVEQCVLRGDEKMGFIVSDKQSNVSAIEVVQARLEAAAACGAEVYTISNPDGSISTVVKPKIATDDSYTSDKDPWHGELRNTVDYYITNGYGITCHNILQTGIVVSILEAKGLKLEDGIQPLAHTHIRINPDKTYSRVWQLLNPRKIHFHDFIK